MFSPFIYFEGVLAQPIRVRVNDVAEMTPAIEKYAQNYINANSGILAQAYHAERQNADLTDGLNYDKVRQVGDASLMLERYAGREIVTVTIPPPAAEAPALPSVERAEERPERPAEVVPGEPEVAQAALLAEPETPEIEIPRIEVGEPSAAGGPVFVIVLPNIFIPLKEYLLDDNMEYYVKFVAPELRYFSRSYDAVFDNTLPEYGDPIEPDFSAWWQSSQYKLNNLLAERRTWFQDFNNFWTALRRKFPSAPVMFVAEPEFTPTSMIAGFASSQYSFVTPRISRLDGRVLSTAAAYEEENAYALANPIPALSTISPITYNFDQPYFMPRWLPIAASASEWDNICSIRMWNISQFKMYGKIVGYNPPPSDILDNNPDAGLEQILFTSITRFDPTYPLFEPVTMLPTGAQRDPNVLGIFSSPGWEFGDQTNLPSPLLMPKPDIWNLIYNIAETERIIGSGGAGDLTYAFNTGILELDGATNPTAVYLDRFKHLYAQLPGTLQYQTVGMDAPPQNFFQPQPYLGWTKILNRHVTSAAGGMAWAGAKVHIIDFNLRESEIYSRWPALSEMAACEATLARMGATVSVTVAGDASGSQQGYARNRPVWDFSLKPDFIGATNLLNLPVFSMPANPSRIISQQGYRAPPVFELQG